MLTETDSVNFEVRQRDTARDKQQGKTRNTYP